MDRTDSQRARGFRLTTVMARPNYSGEKRRKELEKQKKKEEKKRRKLENASRPSDETVPGGEAVADTFPS